MPKTAVIFYREGERVLIREWLKALPVKVQRKCLLYLDLLEQEGHALRRPVADFLRDGIYELRPALQGVNYRILYSVVGTSLLSHTVSAKSWRYRMWKSIGQ